MLRRLVTPRWLGALVLAGLAAFVCYHLGWWQYHRHEAKVERNARIDAHYTADPVPVGQVLGTDPLPLSEDWTRVSATGEYVAGPLFVRGRPLDGEVGVEVLWVLQPEGGGSPVIVDRGWVPQADQGASTLPQVGPAPTGTVTLTGWARPGEEYRAASSENGALASVDPSEVRRATGRAVSEGYVLLERETAGDGSAPPRPKPLGMPDEDLGPHLAYAYQWWFAMGVGFLLVFFGIRREDRLEHPERYPVKEKKVRIWDEEDG